MRCEHCRERDAKTTCTYKQRIWSGVVYPAAAPKRSLWDRLRRRQPEAGPHVGELGSYRDELRTISICESCAGYRDDYKVTLADGNPLWTERGGWTHAYIGFPSGDRWGPFCDEESLLKGESNAMAEVRARREQIAILKAALSEHRHWRETCEPREPV